MSSRHRLVLAVSLLGAALLAGVAIRSVTLRLQAPPETRIDKGWIKVDRALALPPPVDVARNAATLAGIDANTNGVRDDVERALADAHGLHSERAEAAKIEVAQHGGCRVALDEVEAGLGVTLDAATQAQALAAWIARILRAADDTCVQAGLAPTQVQALYFTGGSTGLAALTAALAARFTRAECVRGDRFASVVRGLALSARQRHARGGRAPTP
jgi:hypothetical protein